MHSSVERVHLFGLAIDSISRENAVARAIEWITSATDAYRYVVSPNVDHVVELQRNGKFKRAYRDASMVLADGMPILWASRLLRHALPERIAGPDFVGALLEAAARHGGMRVCLLGGAPGVAQEAARNISRRWPGLLAVEGITPPQQFSSVHGENSEVLRKARDFAADILIVGLGAPKQEIWVNENLESLRTRLVVCAGGYHRSAGRPVRKSTRLAPSYWRRVGVPSDAGAFAPVAAVRSRSGAFPRTGFR